MLDSVINEQLVLEIDTRFILYFFYQHVDLKMISREKQNKTRDFI